MSDSVDTCLAKLEDALIILGPLMSRGALISAAARVHTIFVELQARINSHALINAFPNELLIVVFKNVVAEEELTSPIALPARPDSKVNTKALLQLSHVCRRWRDVALATPTLWSRVDCKISGQLDAFSKRSHAVPMSLLLSTNGSHEQKVWAESRAILERHSFRLRGLDLELVPYSSNVEWLLSLRVPLLESLTVSSTRRVFADHGETLRVPLMCGQTNALKALAILPSVNWVPKNHFPQLTHLYLQCDADPYTSLGSRPGVRDLLFVLSNTPKLEFLHISSLVPGPRGSLEYHPPHSSHVALNSLRSATFTSSTFSLVVDMLSCLRLPGNILLRLDDMHVHSLIEPEPRELPELDVLKHMTYLEIGTSEPDFLHMVAEGPSGAGFWLRARFDFGGCDKWNPWIARLHEAMPLDRIAALRVYVERGHYNEDYFLPALLERTPNVTDLSVLLSNAEDWTVHGPLRTLCASLGPRPKLVDTNSGVTVPSGQHDGECGWMCPALSSVRIEGPYVVCERDGNGYVEAIGDMLAARAHGGCPIRRLCIQPRLECDEEDGDDIPPPPPPMRARLARRCGSFAEHVAVYEMVGHDAGALCPFEVREIWKAGGAEEYWQLKEQDKPRYSGPRE